jgi:ABC-2 type transport system ATP-binding protein
LRVDTPDPVRAVPEIVQQLGVHAGELRGIEVLRPSLDSVFLSLTGRRYAAEGADVAAA